MRYWIIVFLLWGISSGCFAQRVNYRQAEKFRNIDRSPVGRVSLAVRPRFIGNSDCFWYDFKTTEGKKFYYVDPARKTKQLLFDNAVLLAKISEITRKAYSVKDPDLAQTLEFEKDGKTITFDFDRKKWAYHIQTQELKEMPDKSYPACAPYWKKYSADSSKILFARDHNLFVAGNPDEGKDSVEVQLTRDGERYYTFCQEDESVPGERMGTTARWAKRGHRFYVLREDSRKVKELALVDVLATPRPELKTYKAELAGDKDVIQYELWVGDADSGELIRVKSDKWTDQYIDVLYFSEAGDRLYFQRYKRKWDEAEICVADTRTGEVKVLIHEKDIPYLDYQMRAIDFLNDGQEILFRSERTGWGHYYLYDGDGNLKRQVTSGAWVAGPVQKIDTAARNIWFYGYGREQGCDPYYYLLYRVNLDRGDLTLVTPEYKMHNAILSPSSRYFVDNYSEVNQEPRIVLRNAKGKILMDLEKPDVSRLYAMGWKAPERFRVKAADGMTDLYGVMWKPADFDSTRRYPIISVVYPGPFFEYVPTSFSLEDDINARLAQVGFIVIAVGHRGGSPMRGKFYHTYGYGNQRDYPLADDKYAIEQLADRYSFIDGTKVGIYGHSGGGFMSTAALLTYPDFYSAAVSCAGNHDNNIYNKGWVEIHFGVKEEKKTVRDSINGDREESVFSVKAKTNMELVENYKGGLLLVTGNLDKTVHPANTLRVADALIKAGKNFDMIVLPSSTHGFREDDNNFFERKMWFHFARHLLQDNSADYQSDIYYYQKR